MSDNEIMYPEDERKVFPIDWKPAFPPDILKKAETSRNLKLASFQQASDGRGFTAVVMEGRSRYTVSAKSFPQEEGQSFVHASFNCSCQRYSYYPSKCVHVARAMISAEKIMGPFMVKEEYYKWNRRREENRIRRVKAERAARLNAPSCRSLPALSAFQDLIRRQNDSASGIFFDFEQFLAYFTTNSCYTDMLSQGEGLIEYQWIWDRKDRISIQREKDGKRVLMANAYTADDVERVPVVLTASSAGGFQCGCECSMSGMRKKKGIKNELCIHQLRIIRDAWTAALEYSAGGTTDQKGKSFLSLIEKQTVQARKEESEVVQTRIQDIRIVPRISRDDSKVTLSFQIGRTGGRLYILKSYEKLIGAYEESGIFNLGKNADLDFSAETFTDESQPWMTFIQRKYGEIDQANERLSRRIGYVPSLSVGYQQELTGATLDRFYDMAEGIHCSFRDKNSAKDTLIRIGHKAIHVEIRINRLADARGRLAGIMISGQTPVLLPGSSSRYCLSDECLSRLEPDEERAVLPFSNAADLSGAFFFEIGTGDLREFYYRVMPGFMDSPYIEVEDLCGEEALQILPPDAKFRFFMDYDGDHLLMDCDVSYEKGNVTDWNDRTGNDRIYRITGQDTQAVLERESIRDLQQEYRVRKAIDDLGFAWDRVNGHYAKEADTEGLYEFLRTGTNVLFSYGLVHGTDRFSARKIRTVPQIRAGVSIDSDLMNLSITTQGMTTSELMDILVSYRRKRKYHVLKNGEFVNLDENKDLDALSDMMEALGITEKDFEGDRTRLPVFRALYLDKLLEEHDNIVSSGDRLYRNLLRNYRTIRDSDYEVPASMSEVLRPYQAYGFKWLRTLEDTGFGGILADEMGLGKTLQTIALLQANKEAGAEKPSLVVCPASLVYNWEEELHRFAPALDVTVLAGPQAARRKLMSDRLAGGDTDVFVTSYDLMRRDVSFYQKAQFNICVLDEAQYIKNQKAAVSKAVKTIHADHRFALTGTPIENRLAELWSIFDFLMPGFLNSYDDFSRHFDVPITKNRDEKAADHLKKLTGPFILRRLKADVLKDLPARLEEVRYARFDDLQQKIYDGQVARIRDIMDGGLETGQDKMKLLAELTKARQICCDPSLLLENYTGGSAKRAACMDLISSAIDGEHRMLVFSQFTSMLALLEDDLKEAHIPYYKITGSTPKEQRLQLVNAFNKGTETGEKVPVFLISLKAGGTGLNLTGADVVIHYDPWWNLAAQNQATDRAHRIGQEKQVTVYRMIAKGTIEEKILDLQEQKKYLADAILEGRSESVMNLSADELRALLI